MIYSLSGRLLVKEPNALVVECGGVGYRCAVPLSTAQRMPQTGSEVTVFTHMSVREDAVELFGFVSQEELACFKRLISVSGVGPRVALAILTDFPPDKFNLYVATGDVKAITKAQGVGPKLAQRIVLELKDKVELTAQAAGEIPVGLDRPESNTGEAVSALAALGYTPTEAAQAVARQDQSLPVEELIRGALKLMMRA